MHAQSALVLSTWYGPDRWLTEGLCDDCCCVGPCLRRTVTGVACHVAKWWFPAQNWLLLGRGCLSTVNNRTMDTRRTLDLPPPQSVDAAWHPVWLRTCSRTALPAASSPQR